MFEDLTRNSKQAKESFEEQLTQNATMIQEMQDKIDKLSDQLKTFDITHPMTVKASQVRHYFAIIRDEKSIERGQVRISTPEE